MQTIVVETQRESEFVEITRQVQEMVSAAGTARGVVTLFVPHTTAGITLNENADPAVRSDLLADLDRLVPREQPYYRHGERNSASHLKASLVGSSVTVLVENGMLVLGPWQGIYLCEFDGPRTRKVQLTLIEGG
ncbi:MAG: secondary thiamine-phosphate synthase enzyme YjbQ [Anaerolineales bacterium]|jgi:secondary thiamine-phosphate synthase enzyme